MSAIWTPASEERYRRQLDEQVNRGSSLLILLAATLFPSFSILDYLGYPEHFLELSIVRFGTTFIYVILFFICQKRLLSFHPYPFALFILGLAAASITIMCNILEGPSSRYYAGVNLVVLAAGLGYPWNGRRMGAAVSMIVGIYLIGVLEHVNWEVAEPAILINNLFFLMATGIISTATAHHSSKVKREPFERFLEIERARDLLKKELESGQNSLETLVSEVSNRRQELQDTLLSLSVARDQAQKALQLREEFISIASHELKTPLTSMRIQAQTARQMIHTHPEAVDERMRSLIENYGKQIESLVRLIENIFDSSAARAGELKLSPCPMDLGDVVEEVLEQFGAKLRKLNIELRFIKPVPVVGCWDRSRIGQVVANLIANAIKYGEGKPIEVEILKNDETAVLIVRDFGMGIPKEKQERIFERFERAVSHQNISGLGLGLFICNEIVRAHQGTITVESDPGRGSRFTVTLPLNPA